MHLLAVLELPTICQRNFQQEFYIPTSGFDNTSVVFAVIVRAACTAVLVTLYFSSNFRIYLLILILLTRSYNNTIILPSFSYSSPNSNHCTSDTTEHIVNRIIVLINTIYIHVRCLFCGMQITVFQISRV